LGLAGDVFGERLFPIGTVYDPFIARGLDALNYACYQDARFMLVATPSGVTLGPEGGAHQSINPPLIALGQPGLRHYEPAFVDELALLMEEGFRLMQREDGESVYLRLTTRTLEQVERSGEAGRRRDRRRLLAARAGSRRRRRDRLFRRRRSRGARRLGSAEGRSARPGAPGHHLARPAPPRLERPQQRPLVRPCGGAQPCRAIARGALADRRPHHHDRRRAGELSWLGGVMGHKVSPLGIDRFGQTGTLPDLYRAYRLDVDAVVEAAAELFLA
jgi:pyruvate dehydrogenase E1 component